MKKFVFLFFYLTLAACGINTFSNLPAFIAASTSTGILIQGIIEQSPGMAERIYMGGYSSTGFFQGLAKNNNQIQNIQYLAQSSSTTSSNFIDMTGMAQGCVLARAPGVETIQLNASTLKGAKTSTIPFRVRGRSPQVPLEQADAKTTKLNSAKPILVDQSETPDGDLFSVIGHALVSNPQANEELLIHRFHGLVVQNPTTGKVEIENYEGKLLHPVSLKTTAKTIAQKYNAVGLVKIPNIQGNWYAISYEYVEPAAPADGPLSVGMSLYDYDADKMYTKVFEKTIFKRDKFQILKTIPYHINGIIFFMGYGKHADKVINGQNVAGNHEVFFSDAFPSHMNSTSKANPLNFSVKPFQKTFGWRKVQPASHSVPSGGSSFQGIKAYVLESLKVVRNMNGEFRVFLVYDDGSKKEIFSMGTPDGVGWSDFSPLLPNISITLTQSISSKMRVSLDDHKNYAVASGGESFGVAYINNKDLFFMYDPGTGWVEPMTVNRPSKLATTGTSQLSVNVDSTFAPKLGMSIDKEDNTVQILWRDENGNYRLSILVDYINHIWTDKKITLSGTPTDINLQTSVCDSSIISYLDGTDYKMTTVNLKNSSDYQISNTLVPTAGNLFPALYDETKNLSRFLYWDNSGPTYKFQYTYY